MKIFGIDLSRIKREELLYYFSGAIVGGVLSLVSFLFIANLVPFLADIFYVVAAVASIVPFLIKWYTAFNKKKHIENAFPLFLRDLIESVRSGMSLPQAFKTVSDNDYGILTNYIKKMSSQLDWGIPIDKVLINFSKESKSKLVGRIISTVIESHRFGGNLIDTFEALSKTTSEVDRLRRERYIYLQSQMITGYIVFFIFLAVILGLQLFLTPSITALPQGALGIGSVQSDLTPAELAEEYNNIYRALILIQGLFAGLAVGKMSEGSMVAGIKHSLFMMLVGFIAFTVIIENPELITFGLV